MALSHFARVREKDITNARSDIVGRTRPLRRMRPMHRISESIHFCHLLLLDLSPPHRGAVALRCPALGHLQPGVNLLRACMRSVTNTLKVFVFFVSCFPSALRAMSPTSFYRNNCQSEFIDSSAHRPLVCVVHACAWCLPVEGRYPFPNPPGWNGRSGRWSQVRGLDPFSMPFPRDFASEPKLQSRTSFFSLRR